MERGLTINTLMALVWTFLFTPSPGMFLTGGLIAFLFIALFQRVLYCEEYVRRVVGFLRFCLIFLREFVVANIGMLRIVLLQPIERMDPDFLEYDTSHLNRLEILILTHFITLTPGTTSVEVAPDMKKILIHAMDASDPAAIREQLNTIHVPSIQAFTR